MTAAIIVAMVCGLVLWMFLEVAFHEGAHFLAAKFVGLLPLSVVVGNGPLMVRGRLGNTEVCVHWLPRSGLVKVLPTLAGMSWKGPIFSIAGLLSDFAFLALFLNLAGFKTGAPDASQSTPFHFFFAILAVYQVFTVAVNLIPMDVTVGGKELPNDGKQFFGYLTGKTSQALRIYESQVARYDAGFKMDQSWMMKGDPQLLALYTAAQEHMMAGDYAKAVEKKLLVLGRCGANAAEKAVMLDGLACIPIIQGDRRFLQDAEHWARQASELCPHSGTLRGTLGSILVEKGDWQAGLDLLQPLTTADNAKIDRTLASCFAAKAYFHLGRIEDAKRSIAVAKDCGEFPDVRARIESEIALS